MKPAVSVTLPVYNGEKSVEEAIKSVLDQDYPNFEFVIIDNASTDATPAIIDRYSGDPRIRAIRNPHTVPRLDNFILAFAAVDPACRWIKFIGDDDRLLPDCLGEMVRVAEDGERVGLVSSYYYDGDRLVVGAVEQGSEQLEGPSMLRRLLLDPEARRTLFSPASLLISREAYHEEGPFRRELLHADHELFYRILNSYNFAYVHQPLTRSGYHGTSGQAGSTARGDTFAEAYLIRLGNLPRYSRVQLSFYEVEQIKFNLACDSLGFILARLAEGDIALIYRHLRRIPFSACYHLVFAAGYFVRLALKKLLKREPIRVLKKRRDQC